MCTHTQRTSPRRLYCDYEIATMREWSKPHFHESQPSKHAHLPVDRAETSRCSVLPCSRCPDIWCVHGILWKWALLKSLRVQQEKTVFYLRNDFRMTWWIPRGLVRQRLNKYQRADSFTRDYGQPNTKKRTTVQDMIPSHWPQKSHLSCLVWLS